MGDAIGSLEAGKQADVVVHDRGPAWVAARTDPVLQLVWATDGRSVRDVVVAGRVVVATAGAPPSTSTPYATRPWPRRAPARSGRHRRPTPVALVRPSVHC